MYVYTGARSTAENTVSVYMYVYTHKIYINVNMCRGEIDGRQYYELFADNFALLDAEGLFDPIILLPDAYMYIFMCLSVCLSVCLPVCLPVCMYVFLCVYICIYIYLYMYRYMYICIYVLYIDV